MTSITVIRALLSLAYMFIATCSSTAQDLTKNIIKIEDVFVKPSDIANICKDDEKHNYVLGLAGGKVDPCPFIVSWHEHAPETRVVIYTDSDDVKLKFIGVTNIYIIKVKRPPAIFSWHNWRYFMHKYVLQTCVSKMIGVVLSDTRDAVLQGNIWNNHHMARAVLAGEVLFTLEGNMTEAEPTTLVAGTNYWNTGWITNCFEAPAVRDQLLSGLVACSGTILGEANAMHMYTIEFANALMFNTTPVCRAGDKEFEGGHDQAVHQYILNYLQPHGLLPFRAVAIPQGRAPVYTILLGYPIEVNRLGVVTVRRGNKTFVPDLLHQHDRSKDLFKKISQKYQCTEPRFYEANHTQSLVPSILKIVTFISLICGSMWVLYRYWFNRRRHHRMDQAGQK